MSDLDLFSPEVKAAVEVVDDMVESYFNEPRIRAAVDHFVDAAILEWTELALETGALTREGLGKMRRANAKRIREKLLEHLAEHEAEGTPPCITREEIDKLVKSEEED